jgi:hypothetical protein
MLSHCYVIKQGGESNYPVLPTHNRGASELHGYMITAYLQCHSFKFILMQIIYGRAYIVNGHHVIQHNTALYSTRSEFNSWHGVQIIYRMSKPFLSLSPRQMLRQHNRPGVNTFSKNLGATSDIKQIPRSGFTNIRRHRTKRSRHGDLTSGICTSLQWTINKYGNTPLNTVQLVIRNYFPLGAR